MKATAGSALVPRHGSRAKQIVGAADFALSKSKATGVSWSLFESNLAKAATSRWDIEVGLRHAIQTGELRLAYQPIVSASDSTEVVAVEALLRWETSAGNQVPPAEFIPVAESSGLIVEIGAWALREACREAALWSSGVRISVNVSPAQFQHGDFVETVEASPVRDGAGS